MPHILRNLPWNFRVKETPNRLATAASFLPDLDLPMAQPASPCMQPRQTKKFTLGPTYIPTTCTQIYPLANDAPA